MPESHGDYLVTKGDYAGLRFRIHGGWFGGRRVPFFPVIEANVPDGIRNISDRNISGVCSTMEKALGGEIKVIGNETGRLYDYMPRRYPK